MKPLSILFFVFLFSLIVSAQKQKADLIIINAKVHTMEKKDDRAEAIAIRGNKLLAVGKYNKIRKLIGTKTKRIDARGRVVIPGFNDSHVHFAGVGNLFSSLDLKNARSPQDVIQTLQTYLRYIPKGRWILGGQWDNQNWTPSNLPTKELIDRITPDNPVFLYNKDGNIAWANSLALKIGGITKSKGEVAGGEIIRDAEGEPTGILRDNAMTFVRVHTPKASTKQLTQVIETASNYAASMGVTSVQNVHSDDLYETLRGLEREGKLKTRVYDCAPIFDWEKLAAAGIKRAQGDALIRRGCLKFFADGQADSSEDLFKMIAGADKADLQVLIHAIGSSANNVILNVFERVIQENGVKDRRFRVEHAYGFRDSDLERFSRSNIIASLQPHLFYGGQPYESLLKSKANVAFGSDASMTELNPLLGIYDAVTRGNEKLSVEEAVRLYTLGSAYAEFQENVKGSISEGKLADLVILSDDIFEIKSEDIPKTRVIMTIMDGKIVYNERNFTTLPSPNVR